jgi:hypothetical protein
MATDTDHKDTSGPTLIALVVITLVMLFLGLHWARQSFPALASYGEDSACVDTRVEAGQTLHTRDILVSVFNAGQKAGTASATMKKLENRGFIPADTGNTTVAGGVHGVEIWADSVNPAALLVAKQFGAGTQIVAGHEPLGDGVVVVIGDDMKRMSRPVESLVADQQAYICGPPVLQ